MKELRGKALEEMTVLLKEHLEKGAPTLAQELRLGLAAHKKTVRRILARLQDWIDEQCGEPGMFSTSFDSSVSQGCDIEHVMPRVHVSCSADHSDRIGFENSRNRFGKAEQEERQATICRLAEVVWDPARLDTFVKAPA